MLLAWSLDVLGNLYLRLAIEGAMWLLASLTSDVPDTPSPQSFPFALVPACRTTQTWQMGLSHCTLSSYQLLPCGLLCEW